MKRKNIGYKHILSTIQELDDYEQLQLLEDLAVLVWLRVLKKQHSILELQGLGKEIWQNIDAQD